MALKPDSEDAASPAEERAEERTATRTGTATGPAERPEERVESLEEARRVIRDLRERYRLQAQQLLAWRRRVLAHEEAHGRAARDRHDQLKVLSSQLLLFEARLCRKQKDIGRMLAQREAVIVRQQRAIQMLQARLAEAGLDTTHPDLDSPTGETNLDSLNDSDSAVIMEDGPGSDHESALCMFPRFRGGSDAVTVMRSISDAVETPSAKYACLRRSNGFLRRPEVLETVYSVEEDGDGDGTNTGNNNNANNNAESNGCSDEQGQQGQAEQGNPTGRSEDDVKEGEPNRGHPASKADSSSSIDDTPSVDESSYSTQSTPRYWGSWTSWSSAGSGRLQALYGSFERLAHERLAHERLAREHRDHRDQDQPPNHVTTYNRVMSNHRSVTKPKDVKYKRINKAKSKSLEELRGRLRNFGKGAFSLDQSSYA